MANYGITDATGFSFTQASPRTYYNGFDAPAGSYTLTSLSIFLEADADDTWRISVYQGGTKTDPTGATLVWDSGMQTGIGSSGWRTLTAGGQSLTGGQPWWIAYRRSGTASFASFFFTTSTSANGDFWDDRPIYKNTTTGASTAFETNPPGGLDDTDNSYIAMYMTVASAEVPTGTSGGLVVGSSTSFVGEGFVGSIEAAGNTAPTGLASETDTALALARTKYKTAQLATETDAALALTAAHARATGLASETDAALALAWQKVKAIDLASETETALELGRVKVKAVGLATETDGALAATAVKTRSTGRADETDTALAPGAPLGVGIASETDSAFALACLKSKVAQVATTTETALALTARKIRECGTATETDAALNLTPLKVGACGRADETDAAFACPPFGVIARPVGLAVEMDEALALAALVLSEAELPRGGDDVPDRGHRGWDRKRSRLKLRREREFTEQIRDLYRELTGDPRTAERAEAILAPVVAAIPAGGESEAAREAAIEARADALRARADAFEANALQAEIALRLLHRELRDWQEADDLQAIRPLLAQVL